MRRRGRGCWFWRFGGGGMRFFIREFLIRDGWGEGRVRTWLGVYRRGDGL